MKNRIFCYNRRMEAEAILTADMPIAELGRAVLAGQLAIMMAYQPVLMEDAELTAVHETRKAIRRTYTAVRLFHPYFEPGLLDGYRRRLKKLMRRLGRCRDIDVLLARLRAHMADAPIPLTDLEQYWQGQKTAVDANLRRFLEKPRQQQFWIDYGQFTSTPGRGVLPPAETTAPVKARHLIPALLYQRLAQVRAFDDFLAAHQHLAQADMGQLHRLRIQCKELRYALEFFAPLAGPEMALAVAVLEQLQDNLGALNDARIALDKLAIVPARETAVNHYRQVQQAEIGRLLDEFQPLWAAFNSLEWRRNLALALSVL